MVGHQSTKQNKMKTLRKITIIVAVACATLFAGCASLAQIANLINCKFSMANISDITWADINLSNIKSVSDLSLSMLQKAATAIKNKDFGVSANLNVDVKNETTQPAKVFAFDYELLLENNPLASGKNSNFSYAVNPKSTTRVPVPLKVDIVQIIKNGQVGDVVNFARNLSDYGNGKESNVKIKLTPYIGTKKPTKLAPIVLNKTFQSSAPKKN